MEKSGLIYSVHGKGTFVKANTIDSALQKIMSFGDTLKKMGYSGYTKIVSFTERETDDFEGMLRGGEWNKVCLLTLTGYAENYKNWYKKSRQRTRYQ